MPAWSGLWNGVHTDGHKLIGKNNVGRRLGRALKGLSGIKYREVLMTLVEDGVGDTAAATHTRIDASNAPMTFDGVSKIETVVDINRVTTNDDVSVILEDIIKATTPTFPVEKSGNSGGGKLGF